MRRKAAALAVGALFAAPAAHAQITFGNDTIGTVQFYGRLYPQIEYSRGKDASQTGDRVSTLVRTNSVLNSTGDNHGGRLAVETANSRLGFRGERGIGAFGKAIWQVEMTVNIDNPDCGENGFGNESCSGFATRNSFVGLNGGYGTIKLGIMDTIYKEYGDTLNMFGIKSGNFVSGSNVLSHIGVGRSRAARFHERAANSIQYETPSFAGFNAGVQYSPDEVREDAGARFGATDRVNAKLWSYGVKFERGILYASLAHERHYDYFGGSFNVGSQTRNLVDADGDGTLDTLENPDLTSLDTATRFSTQIRLGNHTIVTDIARLKWEENNQRPGVVRFRNYSHTAYALGLESNWGGPWRTAFQYIRANDGKCELTLNATCNTDGLRSWMLTGGLAYYFNRQTLLYVIAARVNNGPSARYDNVAQWNPSRGEDVDQYAIGVSYSF